MSRTPITAPSRGRLLPAAAGVLIAGLIVSVASPTLAVAAGVAALVLVVLDVARAVRRWNS